jgi:hypothetical protein
MRAVAGAGRAPPVHFKPSLLKPKRLPCRTSSMPYPDEALISVRPTSQMGGVQATVPRGDNPSLIRAKRLQGSA